MVAERTRRFSSVCSSGLRTISWAFTCVPRVLNDWESVAKDAEKLFRKQHTSDLFYRLRPILSTQLRYARCLFAHPTRTHFFCLVIHDLKKPISPRVIGENPFALENPYNSCTNRNCSILPRSYRRKPKTKSSHQ